MDDAYRAAAPADRLAPLTIRWSNLAGRGWLMGAFLFHAFLGAAATFGWVLQGVLDGFARGRWSIYSVVLVPISLGMAGFFIIAAIGTGGVTLDMKARRAVRLRGILFIPLLRRTHRLDPESRVYVDEQRVQRRNSSYMTYTAVIDSAGTLIPLRHYFQREHAEAQAERVREYLAG